MVAIEHAQYTRKSQFTEDESKCHESKKGSCKRKLNKLHTGKEWRLYAQ